MEVAAKSLLSSLNLADDAAQQHVRFSRRKPEVHTVENHRELSDDEYFSYWIQPGEMDKSVDHCWDTIDAWEKVKKENKETTQLCTRGLESYIIERRKGKKLHRIKRRNAYTVVLLCGRRLSSEEIARRYQTVSGKCIRQALEFARKDANIAKRIHEEQTKLTMKQEHSQRGRRSIKRRKNISAASKKKSRSSVPVVTPTDGGNNSSSRGGLSSTGCKKEKNRHEREKRNTYRHRTSFRSKSPQRQSSSQNDSRSTLTKSHSSGNLRGNAALNRLVGAKEAFTGRISDSQDGQMDESRPPRWISPLLVASNTKKKPDESPFCSNKRNQPMSSNLTWSSSSSESSENKDKSRGNPMAASQERLADM